MRKSRSLGSVRAKTEWFGYLPLLPFGSELLFGSDLRLPDDVCLRLFKTARRIIRTHTRHRPSNRLILDVISSASTPENDRSNFIPDGV